MIKQLARPYPLGATLSEYGCNFSIYAPNNKSIALALFDTQNNYTTFPLEGEVAGIRFTHLENIKAGQKYGYIITTENGQQLLSDPYAKAIDAPLSYIPPYDNQKSFNMPKCVVTSNDFDWQQTKKPHIAREKTILFETHVKGVSKLNPNVPIEQQGTYLGLVSPAMLAFYKQQNMTTLQLLPVTACMHEPHLLEMGKVNYWGYNPYLFMAPDPRYAITDAVTELKTAIRELHRNGIEVILDVVYNHTAEGGDNDTVFNLKGLDQHYYLKHGSHFANFTGCGNTVDLSYQPALNLVMDTLRYWVQEYKVDGFRFDLAATLGREGDNFNPGGGFFKAVAQDPVLKGIKLIAEPWDIGPNGYQVGQFPFGWNECNDKLRDVMRSFWRGDSGYLKEFATRLMGSRDLYSASRWPYNMTVNYLTYHDGFTMQDLVSYKGKHNEANGENNRDGHSDNRSANYGIEGETDDLAIQAYREKQKRNMMTSLLFSFGIPHILTADILSHSQQGNNNAYCQDNEIGWLNWQLTPNKQDFSHWLAEMIKARHQYMKPFIHAFSRERRDKNRISWYRADGTLMDQDDWNHLSSVSLHLGINKDGAEILYLINQTQESMEFKLPNDRQQNWLTICNTQSNQVKQGNIKETMCLPASSIAILHFQPIECSI